MKKIIALMLTLALCLSFAACSSQSESEAEGSTETVESETTETVESEETESEVVDSEAVESEESEQPEVEQVAADPDFVEYFNSIVIRVAPGTSGSSVKAAGAVENLIAWSEDKKPDNEVVKASVKEYLATSEFGLEAVDAFDMIEDAVDSVRAGNGGALFEDVELVEVQLNGDAGTTLDTIIAAVNEYKAENENLFQ